jgi:hypothetical protein
VNDDGGSGPLDSRRLSVQAHARGPAGEGASAMGARMDERGANALGARLLHRLGVRVEAAGGVEGGVQRRLGGERAVVHVAGGGRVHQPDLSDRRIQRRGHHPPLAGEDAGTRGRRRVADRDDPAVADDHRGAFQRPLGGAGPHRRADDRHGLGRGGRARDGQDDC